MPRVPDEFDWDLDMPGSRFTARPTIAIGFPEEEGYDRTASRAALGRHVREWVFEEQDEPACAAAALPRTRPLKYATPLGVHRSVIPQQVGTEMRFLQRASMRPRLGKGEAVESSYGRGASGIAAALEFVAP